MCNALLAALPVPWHVPVFSDLRQPRLGQTVSPGVFTFMDTLMAQDPAVLDKFLLVPQ